MKKAFTLAETLTTLIVIGVIAVVTLPVLNSEVNTKVSESQKKTFKTKFNAALQLMQVKGVLGKRYESTEEFVKMMKKYANISHSCDANNLDTCFAAKINQDKKTVKYVTKTLKTSDMIEAPFSAKTNINGIVFADGSNALIAYNPDCIVINQFDPTANLSECFSMIYDVNGKDAPNVLGEDIQTINIGATTELDFEIGGVVVGSPMTISECQEALANGAPTTVCDSEENYYAGVVYACWNMEPKGSYHLATANELSKFATKIYGTSISVPLTKSSLEIADYELWNSSGLSRYAGKEFFYGPMRAGGMSCQQFNANGVQLWGCSSTNAYSRKYKHGLCVKSI